MHLLTRLGPALVHSMSGFKYALKEPAFLLEVILFMISVPLVAIMPIAMPYKVFIICAHILVLIVELLNTAIERTLDRVSKDFHELTKTAKDLASAAVFLAIAVLVIAWIYGIREWLTV